MKDKIIRDFVHYEVRRADSPYGASYMLGNKYQFNNIVEAEGCIQYVCENFEEQPSDFIIVKVEHREMITREGIAEWQAIHDAAARADQQDREAM